MEAPSLHSSRYVISSKNEVLAQTQGNKAKLLSTYTFLEKPYIIKIEIPPWT